MLLATLVNVSFSLKVACHLFFFRDEVISLVNFAGAGTVFQLREPVSRYNTVLGIKKELENTYSGDINSVFSRG
ncbi:MAG: hypothetical protein K8F52_09195 [Candidatus Scalindua rubra]|nr:hypothetical protein [Candidatus Scalindua rubra]